MGMKKMRQKGRSLELDRAYDTLSAFYVQLPYRFLPSRAFPPLHLIVELTYRCNLRCAMCQFLPLLKGKALGENIAREITAAEIAQFVQAFPRTAVVTLTGGEPLLRNDFRAIVRSLAGRNKIHIITNGTLLTGEAVAFLWDHRLRSVWGSGILALGVSLHGPAELHDRIVGTSGAFENARRGIGLLNDLKRASGGAFPHIHLTAVITGQNAPHLSRIYEIAAAMKADYCNFTLFNTSDFSSRLDMEEGRRYESPPPRGVRIDPALLREQFSRIQQTAAGAGTKVRFSPFGITPEEVMCYYDTGLDLAAFRCTAPWRLLGISAYGDMSSCPFMSLGNIRDAGPAGFWNSPAQQKFRRALKQRRIYPACEGCCQSSRIG